MNKNIKILIVIVTVLGLAFWLISRKPWSTLKGELKDFAIKDTASITKIFLAERQGNQVLLTRSESGIWMVNNTYKADPVKINLLLATMHDVSVRNPLGEKEHNTVVASLATASIKAEFYTSDGLLKTIYVGSGSADQTGTFMLIEGSTVPYITHIKGFVGYLTPRFYPFAIKWRSKEVFTIPEEKLNSVKVVYPQQPELSFEILNGPAIQVKDNNGKLMDGINVSFAKYYLACFSNLFIEGFDDEMPSAANDSIRNTQPFCIITAKHHGQEETKLTLLYKPVDKRTKLMYDNEGNLLPRDTEKYFAYINNDTAIAYAQQFVFGKVLKTVGDFTVRP